MNSSKYYKNAMSFFLSLFLLFNIVLLCICLFIYTRMLNSKYYISVFSKNQYYKSVSKNIEKELTVEARQRNISKNVFAQFWDETWIKNEVDIFAADIIDNLKKQNGEFKNIDFSRVQKKYSESFDEFLKLNNTALDDRLQNEKNDLRLKAEQVVLNNINVFDIKGNMKSEEISVLMDLFRSIYSKLWIYIVALVLVLTAIPVILKTKVYTIFLWYGYSAVAAGLLLLLCSVGVYLLNITGHLPFSQEYVKLAVDRVVKGYILYFTAAGILTTAAGGVLLYFNGKKQVQT